MKAPKYIDLTGQVFGRLTVIRKVKPPGKNSNAYWLCKCSCGNEMSICSGSLRTGCSKSCGCLFKEINSTHGLSGHHLYQVWNNMMSRCYNKSYIGYLNYGGSGVEVCERWHNPINFIADMEVSYREGLTLDRKNNDGDYEPSNCKWSTMKEQAANRRPALHL